MMATAVHLGYRFGVQSLHFRTRIRAARRRSHLRLSVLNREDAMVSLWPTFTVRGSIHGRPQSDQKAGAPI